ncbi:ABC-three component system protein [Campylobacter pinnipediorum]|uniref:ABC-three component systems C-terminal domain-containing protein n=1 Tax=Campylobacter pinnipediorum subsp. pinnipediorum TaxID=1660067 RepID=A0AAX0LA06_9BACT|nr:ABC-three component system protein [Campylobacter pinnipediorum]AQW82887.1 hypothetical protein CPIN17261_0877 [Campylobacter pinnipediorum subsp. pinnipediorum]OPA77229.1 hypothetical protein BFG04_03800 [Campylobacter pinnipediorum subsp. pinnipediorum]
MLDKSQNITANNNSNAAGRDINHINIFLCAEANSKAESSIQKILLKISDFTTDVEYEKPDTKDYTIEKKIEYNELTNYKKFFDEYMENYNIVAEKIKIISETDPAFESKMIKYMRNIYMENNDDKANANEILDKIIKDIKYDLIDSDLNADDKSYIIYVVFYVFARCKIFKKPPSK